MSETLILGFGLVVIFLILALVTIFKFDSIKHTFRAFGFKIGISGTKKYVNRTRDKHEPINTDANSSGKASIKIGGRVTSSLITSEGSKEGKIKIGKDVNDSKLNARSKDISSINISGNIEETNIDVRAGDDYP